MVRTASKMAEMSPLSISAVQPSWYCSHSSSCWSECCWMLTDSALSSDFNSDLLAISVSALKSLLQRDVNCLPPYMGLFFPSSCWSCSSQVLQGTYLIQLFQPVLSHSCQCIGNSPQLLAVLSWASSSLNKHLQFSSRSFTDPLPPVCAAAAESPPRQFPSAVWLKLSSQHCGCFPCNNLVHGSEFACFCSCLSSSGWGGRSNPLTAAINRV